MIDPIRTSPNALTGRPRHVAIIMDGNRRWARERSLRPLEGHRAGAQTLRAVVRAAAQAQLEILTVFAFSEENWGRDPGEVVALMELIRLFALRERESLLAENVRVRTIGRVERLPEPTKAALAELVAATARNDGLLLNIALNYGARTELCDAIPRWPPTCSAAPCRSPRSTKTCCRAISTPPGSPIRICSSAPAESCAFRTSSSTR